MATPEQTAAVSPPEREPLAAGAFVPDASAIERLANAFFQGVTGGAPVSSPAAGPASPPASWPAPAQPSAPLPASVIPAQPPFVQPDVPTNGVPSSVPHRSLGASAGSASPFAFAQSRAVAPAVSQTAIAAPRADPLQDVDRSAPLRGDAGPDAYPPAAGSLEPAALAVSPFSAPVDLSAALSALRAATQRGAPELSVGAGNPSSRRPAEAGYELPDNAASPARPPAIPTAEALQSAELADPRRDLGRSDSSEEAQQAYKVSPFAAPFDLNEAQLGWIAATFKAPPTDPAATRNLSPASSASGERATLPAEPSVTGAPTASIAAAPAAAIAPVFIDASSGIRTYDAAAVRNDFPILQEKIHGRRLIWLDNGATTQKPQAVIDRLAAFYAHENSNVHRGAHTLAARATDAYEAARDKVRRFIGAS
jgi:cysteine desulfurase/selenocysteine lyase